MSFETWVSTDGVRVKAALEEALQWCEQFNVVADAPTSDEGRAPFWHLVLSRTSYLASVAVGHAKDAEPWLLETLHDAGCLRLFAEGVESGGNLIWCTRGVETRVLMASGEPGDRHFEATTLPWVFFGGVTAELPSGVAELVKQLRTGLQHPSDAQVEELVTNEQKAPVYQRQIRSVRDAVVSDASTGCYSLFELDEDTQVLALWSTLFGEGTLDLEQAIRLGAQRLRSQGWLEYQALRQAGEIYKTIEARLRSARRGSAPFDRPKPGHIRAIEPDPERFTAEDWRDCLMGALAAQHRVDRNRAIRLAFNQAQEQYGLGVQRLRGGGKAERAIKSAINSAIRQGYLQRDGAMYLTCLAEMGAPIQRGIVEQPVSEPTGEGSTPDADTDTDTDEEAITEGGGAGWQAFAAASNDQLEAVPLVELELPTRMRNFVNQERISSVGELLARSYEELMAQPNLGLKSLNDTLDAIQEYKAECEAPIEHASFLEAWRAQLANLKPLHRMVVSRRSGLHGSQETLEELGTMLGVSRERVRQIEARVVERLREKPRWRRGVLRHLEAVFGGGRAVPLDVFAQEPWWSGMDREEHLLTFLVRRVFEREYDLFTAPSGRRYLVKFQPEEFETAQKSALERASRLGFPTQYAAVLAIVESECSRVDPVLLEELEAQVREQLHFSADGAQVTGFGANHRGEVLAFLNAQPKPVSVGEVEAEVGRGQLPEEVLYFKRGLVGLKKHFPDFDSWQQKLVPAAIEVMSARPVGRQWLVPEIHEELELQRLIPEWLGHWHLASLLRSSGQVAYLGRLRVALEGSEQQERLHFEELLLELIEDAGEPLGFEELLRRARQRTDIRDETAKLVVMQAPFVRLDRERVGLVQRDIPGAPESVVEAVEAVSERLSSSQRGLTSHQASQLVQSLSKVHAAWTRELIVSVLRSEATLRLDRSRNIGLDEWDDARCPSRAEFIRREVQRAGGRLAVSTLSERLAEMYGRAPELASLVQLADQVGLVRAGDQLLRPTAEVDEAPASVGSLRIDGIPTELREMFDDLVKEPLSAPGELFNQIDAHVQAFSREHQVNELVDFKGAQQLAGRSRQLLERWDQLPVAERHLAQAAIRYFVIAENVEADFDIGGLDDDKRIMNAVLEHLGLNDGAALAAAS